MSDFQTQLSDIADDVNETLDGLLEMDDDPEAQLIEAMRYSALDGGKRIRPFMVVASADLFNVDRTSSLRAAAAVEMVHCYSLVHDDLPAMDDDDLRRGQPTCHKKYDEATAILAGDALLTKAFEVLAEVETHGDPMVRSELVLALARAAGAEGMVGGQMLDLVAEQHSLKMPEITRLQRMKTGMLIAVSCEAGGILGKAAGPARHALRAYAHDLGLAFQIVDDLLDVEGDVETVGKATGKDAEAGKATFVSLLGVEAARAQALLLADQAAEHLDFFAEKADSLKDLAHFVIKRSA
ncbi:MAG: polyprenyl synthetase family protein [Rhodospirillaceae bacterium]|jgi:farnesyl diphosphate synthase|nr:polyprenyl synthetase family protein [Rhodospirillaceae bacterium]MBT4220119.1 polyprenyl synthetase family protein [Rhodospirillaceae bacterium]MBT5013760.1 polyprenyl synthetase family protein [Rhodospirillaceae bacterium]MBT5309193.1 polyprenyl synthetase family protein [Rhodospirillaceae bacterium]MBT7356044.1 polyprenyl synthetase family protein [Rhodospirillaceae bacterium]